MHCDAQREGRALGEKSLVRTAVARCTNSLCSSPKVTHSRGRAMRAWLIGAAGAATAMTAAYAYFSNDSLSKDAVRTACVASEGVQSPALRLETCTCFTDEVASALWAARMRLMPEERQEASREVALNACRAKAFQRLGGDRAPTRMSPMPKLTD